MDMYDETNLRVYFWNQETNAFSGSIKKKLTGEVDLDRMNDVANRYDFGGAKGSSADYRVFGRALKDGWSQNKVLFSIPFHGPSYNISVVSNYVDFLYYTSCTVTGMEVFANAFIVSVNIDVTPYVNAQAVASIRVSKK